MDVEVKGIVERFERLSDEALLRVVTVDRHSYRDIALELAGRELVRRGVLLNPPVVNHPGASAFQHGPAPTNVHAESYSPVHFFLDLALVAVIGWSMIYFMAAMFHYGFDFFSFFLMLLIFPRMAEAGRNLRKKWRHKAP